MANNGGVYTWDKTPANNAGADSTVNYQEGQAPSSLNDSARNAMTSVAKWRDDISGAIVTGGTSAAYTVTSNQNFDTLAHLHGQVIAFTPHATNAAGPVTMTVDAFANLPLRTAPNTELAAGVLIQGTPYVAVYNNTDGALYLQGFFGNPYNIPLAGGMDYWGTVVPNSSFAFPIGQAISRTTYAALFAIMGTTYGVGNGTTTFNLPDKTGRVSAMKEAAATRLTVAGSGINGATMGAVGGTESRTLLTANLPPYTPAGSIANGAITLTNTSIPSIAGGNNNNGGGGGAFAAMASSYASIAANQAASTFTGTAQGGTSTPVATVPPMILCNYIIRII